MKPISYKPIGTIRTQFTETLGMPIQAAMAKNSVLAVAEISREFTEGLTDLNGFSHIILIYHFHKSGKAPLMQKPFSGDKLHGVFSIRSPRRPNPIGISIVELVRIEGNLVYFHGADMLDETPLLDIKPFVPRFDNRKNASSGWLTAFDQA